MHENYRRIFTIMKVICIEEEAFFQLIEQTLKRFEGSSNPIQKWIGDKEAMQILNIKSKTTLQRLRDEGKIRYSQPMHKLILYDRDSILQYIEDHAQDTF